MKTTEQVCREYGFEYAPIRVVLYKKKKVQLRDLTPGIREQKDAEKQFLRDFVILVGSVLLFVLVSIIIGGILAS